MTIELSQSTAPAIVPPLLTGSTLKAAVLVAAGKGATVGAISAQVAALTKAALHALVLAKVKMAAAFLVTVAVLGLGVGTVAQQVMAERQSAPVPKISAKSRSKTSNEASLDLFQVGATDNADKAAKPRPPEAGATETVMVTGQVLDPQGKPMANAHVAVLASPREFPGPGRMQTLGQADSGSDGGFQLTLPRTSSVRHYSVRAFAAAPGYGPDWQEYDPDAEQPRVTLRLQPEQVLRGRLVDLQGEAAKNVTLHVEFLARKEGPGVSEPAGNAKAWIGTATTDADARFVLRGIGENQDVTLKVQDDRYARQQLVVPASHKDRAREVSFVLAPPHVVTGRITYADSGQPVAAARIPLMVPGETFYGHTDPDGRYELPVTNTQFVTVYAAPPKGEPYLIRKKTVEWPKGVVRHPVDLTLPRGIPVHGKVVESPSGRPVAGAIVQFFAQQTKDPDPREGIASLWHSTVRSDGDGDFQIILPPGAAHLLVDGPTPDYVHEKIAYGILAEGKVNYGKYLYGPEGNMYFSSQRVYAPAIVPLTLDKGAKPEPVRVVLRRGVTLQGRVLGSDGKPVARAWMLSRLNISPWDHMVAGQTDIYDGRFELHGCDPEAIYRVIFFDQAKQEGAVAEIAGKHASPDPVIVRLQPCGRATARIVNGGQPVRNRRVQLDLVLTPGASGFDGKQLKADTVWVSNLDSTRYGHGPRTDGEGRLTLPALIPGATYRIEQTTKVKDCTVDAGKSADWGDIVNAVCFREPE